MIIRKGKVWQANGTFKEEDVHIKGAYIVDKSSGIEINAQGNYVIPGLIDLHIHGSVGADFCDGTQEACQKIALYQASQGILGLCPTTMTYPSAVLYQVVQTCNHTPHADGASFLGIHLEGPYLSMNKCGAQNQAYLEEPSLEDLKAYHILSDQQIVRCDLAPELPGAMAFIEGAPQGIRIAIGHTEAGAALARQAIQRGAHHLTHGFNAMKGIHHRAPGPVLAGWEEGATIELIADGEHVHPTVIKMVEALYGIDRLIFVSDSMRACGMADGSYEIGGQSVIKKGKRATLESDNQVLAGSVTHLMDMVRWAHQEMGMPLGKVVKAVTLNPATYLGIAHQWGKVSKGYLANILILDAHLNLTHVIKEGRLL